MAVAEVCRLTAEGITASRSPSSSSAPRVAQPAPAGGAHFPADTAVIAVICDDSHPPHARPLRAHGPHGRNPRRSVGAAGARGDVMNADRVSAENLPVPARVVETDRHPRLGRGGGRSRADGRAPCARRVRCSSPRWSTILAAVAAWPIYRDVVFGLLVGVTARSSPPRSPRAHGGGDWGGLAGGRAPRCRLLVLAGVPLAVPSRLGAARSNPAGSRRRRSAGRCSAWKDLVTVELPVGSYRNLLVPALMVFLVGTCAVLLLSWREDAVAVRGRARRARDGLVRAVLRPHDRERAAGSSGPG